MASSATPLNIQRVAAPLRQKVVDALRQEITDGRFPQGSRLVERELCELTGVSRTLIREALRQLETEGLVTVIPNRGPVVREIDMEEARQIYEVRASLEGLACALFAGKATPADHQTLRDMKGTIGAMAGQGDLRGVLREKNRLYDLVTNSCGNQVLAGILQPLLARISILRSMSIAQPGRLAPMRDEVDAIIDAIIDGNRERIFAATSVHVDNARRAAIAAMDGEARAAAKQAARS